MARMRTLRALTALVLLLALPACAAESSTSEDGQEASGSGASTAVEQRAALLEVDTSATPDGANVDQLVTIDEVRAIIGMDQVFFAVPAG